MLENEAVFAFRLERDVFFLIVFCLLTAEAKAEDFYIAQNGSGTGKTSASPLGTSFFNTGSNWASPKTSGKIGPGDTVRIVGTISVPLIFQRSGLAGAPITLLFEPGAKMSAPAWPGGDNPSDGAIAVYKGSYIVIDGGVDGLIENTDNGTVLGRQVATTGVNLTGCQFTTVQNLRIANLYVRVAGPQQDGFGLGIMVSARNTSFYSDIRITNCKINDVSCAVRADYSPAGAKNLEIDHNTFTRINWGGCLSDRGNGSFSGTFSFHDNQISDFKNWDDTSAANNFHHDGFYSYAESGGTNSATCSFYNNTIGPNFSGSGPVNHATSGFFFSGRGLVGTNLIFNNVFLAGLGDNPSNGMIYMQLAPAFKGHIYNNTFT